jgi:site-specific recombinase XerD
LLEGLATALGERLLRHPASAPNPTPSALQRDILSFARHCRAGNLSPKTTQTYTESALRLAEYLAEQGMPSDISAIRREHIESFITDQLDRHKPTTAHNRYRGVQAFFRWALDEGLVKDSPMARMRPPRLPEAPPPILREAELRALIAACERDTTFAGRRGAAIVRIFLDTGARLSEVAELRWDPDNDLSNDVDLDAGQLRVIGKGRRERLVSIGNKAVRAVDRYLRLWSQNPYAYLPWLWLGQKGRRTRTDDQGTWPARSHRVLSSPSLPIGVEVLTVAPDAPHQAECLAHAVTEGVHLALAGGPLARIVGGDDRVVLDAHDCHPVGSRAEVAVARLAHVPGGFRIGALAA